MHTVPEVADSVLVGAGTGCEGCETGGYGCVGDEGHVDAEGEADAVEASVGDDLGDVVDAVVLEAFGDVGFHVACPIDAAQFETFV